MPGLGWQTEHVEALEVIRDWTMRPVGDCGEPALSRAERIRRHLNGRVD